MNEIVVLRDKIAERRNFLSAKRKFCREHKFVYEQQFVQAKLDVIDPILSNLNGLISGTLKASDINLEF